jgi:hypothetical protein
MGGAWTIKRVVDSNPNRLTLTDQRVISELNL